MKKSKNKSTETKTSKRAAKRVVKSYSGVEKFKKFMKRYWYWPVTLVVLLGVSLGWCYGLGFFDEPVELIYSGPEEVDMYVNSYYNLNVKSTDENLIVNYYVEKGFEDIINVDSLGKIYAKKSGIGKVIAEIDNVKKSIYVNVSLYRVIWVLQVGDKISYDDMVFGLGKHVNGINSYTVSRDTSSSDESNSNAEPIQILKEYTGEKGTLDWGYEVINEGRATLLLSSSKGVLCEAEIYAYQKLEEGQRQFEREPNIYQINQSLDTTKISRTIELLIDETYEISPISFNVSGNIIYHSSTPGVVNLHQDGSMTANAEGTTIVSILCTGEDTYENYKIRVKVPEIPFYKNIEDTENSRTEIYLDETIKESELRAFYGGERLYEYRTNSNAFNVYYDENGEKCFEAVKLTDTQDAFIIAYDRNGIAVFKFKVNIIEKPEDE